MRYSHATRIGRLLAIVALLVGCSSTPLAPATKPEPPPEQPLHGIVQKEVTTIFDAYRDRQWQTIVDILEGYKRVDNVDIIAHVVVDYAQSATQLLRGALYSGDRALFDWTYRAVEVNLSDPVIRKRLPLHKMMAEHMDDSSKFVSCVSQTEVTKRCQKHLAKWPKAERTKVLDNY